MFNIISIKYQNMRRDMLFLKKKKSLVKDNIVLHVLIRIKIANIFKFPNINDYFNGLVYYKNDNYCNKSV